VLEGASIVFFTMIGHPNQVPKTARGKAFLILDMWDDWGKFRTQFQLVVVDYDGVEFAPGSVKIGEFGLQAATFRDIKPGFRAPSLPGEFDALHATHFSLGTNETYYETLNSLPVDLRDKVLKGLNDCASDLELFERALDEPVMRDSLLRDISIENVRNRYHRLALGDVQLTEFWFEYAFPDDRNTAQSPPVLTFHVKPHSQPPTNVHVLIGRNGVGKTQCLQRIARTILTSETGSGELRQLGDNGNDWAFAGLVFVSFSAFDKFDLPDARRSDLRASMVSLRIKPTDEEVEAKTKTPADLARDFYESFIQCREGLKALRWLAAINTLENDPLFAEVEIESLLEVPESDLVSEAIKVFHALSSGHAIVLLTITRLVDLVDERTLVLLEEPEGHLHPPLLSAFIRALADLLIKRNGVAIIATHSPVVLQEVPKSCVSVLRRTGNVAVAEEPSMETFGENVGVLTREVFGLEVTTAGFHQMLRHAVEIEGLDYHGVIERFDGQLGAEARAITRALISERDAQESS
jgi:predicted ATPase